MYYNLLFLFIYFYFTSPSEKKKKDRTQQQQRKPDEADNAFPIERARMSPETNNKLLIGRELLICAAR